MKNQDTYSEPTILEYPGCVAKVYHPILTDEERQRRMKAIAKSAERLLRKED